jgi:hypothetical protein
MRRWAFLLLAAGQILHAQTGTGPLQKGATVRVWSAHHGLVARKGWIDARSGDSLTLKVAADAHLEYDDRWQMITLARWEVDTIDVQAQGRWWRSGFTDASPRLLPEVAPAKSALTQVPNQTPVRLWSRANRLDGAQAVLVNQRDDTLDVAFGRPSGAATRDVRSIATSRIDRLQVPARGFAYGKGAWRGFAIGATLGFGGTLLTDQCTKQNCTIVPPLAIQNGLIGAGSGIVLGLLSSYWSHHRWKTVDLR